VALSDIGRDPNEKTTIDGHSNKVKHEGFKRKDSSFIKRVDDPGKENEVSDEDHKLKESIGDVFPGDKIRKHI